MAASFNRVTLVGFLGRDPTSTFLPSGDQVTSFNVACTERWKDRSGVQQEHTLWFSCSAFGRLAERSHQFLHKGAYVYVEGRLSTHEYTDRQGQARTSLDVRCAEMRPLDQLPDSGLDRPFGAIAPQDPSTHLRSSGGDQSLLDEVPF